MSYNFKCGQFDDSFSPKRLGNWSDNSRPNRRFRKKYKHKTYSGDFIADDRGHLLPNMKRMICKKSNHWGYPVVSVWDELFRSCSKNSLHSRKCQKEFSITLKDMPRFYRRRSPLAHCMNSKSSILGNCNIKFILQQQFEILQCRCPPVVWIFGYPHKCIEERRIYFAECLAKKLDFVYINPERVLTLLAMKYLNYCPAKNSRAWYWTRDGKSERFLKVFSRLPNVLEDCPPSIQRVVSLIENILQHRSEAFNTLGILQVIKMLFLTFRYAKGYVVDGFPVTLSEADEYEREFWPVAAGIYFQSSKWMEEKRLGKGHCNPILVRPRLFLRNNDYSESLVEEAADSFGDVCIKVENTDCLGGRDFLYSVTVIKDIVIKYSHASGCGDPLEFELEDLADECLCSCETLSFAEPPKKPSVREELPEPMPPYLEEEEKEEEDEEEDDEEDEDEDLEEPSSDLELQILSEFPNSVTEKKVKKKVEVLYSKKHALYSHYIPDRQGVETATRTGLRHHDVAEILKNEMKHTDDESPLSGTLQIVDPAKPGTSQPKDSNKLFEESKGLDKSTIHLDELAYVERILKLEREKLEKDMADREYRRRLSHTTYRSEPPADLQTVNTIFPPKEQNFEEDDVFAHLKPRSGEKLVSHEDRMRDVFHPEQKFIDAEDKEFKKTYVPNIEWFNTPEESLKYERTKKGYKPRQGKPTIVDKVKGKLQKFRSYIQPVPKVPISAADRLAQWEKEHPKGWEPGEYKTELDNEFRHD